MFFGGASFPAAGKRRPYVHHFPPIHHIANPVQNPYGARRRYNAISWRTPGVGGTPSFYSLLQDPSSVLSPVLSPATPGFPAYGSVENVIRCVNVVREVYRLLKIRQDPTGSNFANNAFSLGGVNGYGTFTASLLAGAVQYLNSIHGNNLLVQLLADLDNLINNGVKANGSPLVPGAFQGYYNAAVAGPVIGVPTRSDFRELKERIYHLVLSDSAAYHPASSTVVAEPQFATPAGRRYSYYRLPPGSNIVNI